MDEKTACEPREDCGVEESESGLVVENPVIGHIPSRQKMVVFGLKSEDL